MKRTPRTSRTSRSPHAGLATGLLALAFLLAGCDAPSVPLLEGVEVAVRGHTDLIVEPSGETRPLILAGASSPAICLRAPSGRDTTGWRLRSGYGAQPADETFRPPDARLGRTVCFDAPPPDSLADGEHDLCFDLLDENDGRGERPPCRTVTYRAQDEAYATVAGRFTDQMRQRQLLGRDAFVDKLGQLSDDIAQAGYPFLSMRTRLVQVTFLRQAERPAATARAAEILSTTPSWFERPDGDAYIAQHAYERAGVLLDAAGSLEAAWQSLATAADHYERIADPRRITVEMKQAEVLGRAGSLREARDRLAQAIEGCGEPECSATFALAAADALAALTLQDPDALPEDIRRTADLTQRALDILDGDGDPFALANGMIHLAHARVRAEGDPTEALDRAREVLSRTSDRPQRRAALQGRARVVEALHLLQDGRPGAAANLCKFVTIGEITPDLTRWAWSCVARSEQAQGRTMRALQAVEQALALHRPLLDDASPDHAPVAPGLRSRDVYLAARLLVDLDRPDQAWAMLEQLDRAGPAPAGRRAPGQVAGFRAFASDGDVILLHRETTGGTVSVHRRHRFDPTQLITRLDRIEQAVRRGDMSREEWARLAAPIAHVLVPARDALRSRTHYSLHGALQRVPVAALPMPVETVARPASAGVPSHESSARRPVSPDDVLAQSTLVVHRAAGDRAAQTIPPPPTAAPLFIVDPSNDVRNSRRVAEQYRTWFPEAAVFHGAEATAAAVEGTLPGASGLHVDTRARSDLAFPQKTRLALAGGDVPAADWIDRASTLGFVNLSSSGAAGWPVTADSGRFGVAGLFARAGTPWVITARTSLPDRVVVAFNERFYRELHLGQPVPEAYRKALGHVVDHFQPVDWASLVLVAAPESS